MTDIGTNRNENTDDGKEENGEQIMLRVAKSNIYIKAKVVGSTDKNYVLKLHTGEEHEVDKNIVVPGKTFKGFEFVSVNIPTSPVVNLTSPVTQSAAAVEQLEQSQDLLQTFRQSVREESLRVSAQQQDKNAPVQASQPIARTKRGQSHKSRIPLAKKAKSTQTSSESSTSNTQIVNENSEAIQCNKRSRKVETEVETTNRRTKPKVRFSRSGAKEKSAKQGELTTKRKNASPDIGIKPCSCEEKGPNEPNKTNARRRRRLTTVQSHRNQEKKSHCTGNGDFMLNKPKSETTVTAVQNTRIVKYPRELEDERTSKMLDEQFSVGSHRTENISPKRKPMEPPKLDLHLEEQDRLDIPEPTYDSGNIMLSKLLEKPVEETGQLTREAVSSKDVLSAHPREAEADMKMLHDHERSIYPREREDDLPESAYLRPPKKDATKYSIQNIENSRSLNYPPKPAESPTYTREDKDRVAIPEPTFKSVVTTPDKMLQKPDDDTGHLTSSVAPSADPLSAHPKEGEASMKIHHYYKRSIYPREREDNLPHSAFLKPPKRNSKNVSKQPFEDSNGLNFPRKPPESPIYPTEDEYMSESMYNLRNIPSSKALQKPDVDTGQLTSGVSTSSAEKLSAHPRERETDLKIHHSYERSIYPREREDDEPHSTYLRPPKNDLRKYSNQNLQNSSGLNCLRKPPESSTYHREDEDRMDIPEPTYNSVTTTSRNSLKKPDEDTGRLRSGVVRCAAHATQAEAEMESCRYSKRSIYPREREDDLQQSPYLRTSKKDMKEYCRHGLEFPNGSDSQKMREDVSMSMSTSQGVEDERNLQKPQSTCTEKASIKLDAKRDPSGLKDKYNSEPCKGSISDDQPEAWIIVVALLETRWLKTLSCCGLCFLLLTCALLLYMELYADIAIFISWTFDDHWKDLLCFFFVCIAADNIWCRATGLRKILFYKALSLSITIVLSYSLLRVALDRAADVLPLHIAVPCTMRMVYGTLGLLLLSRGKQVPTTFFERTTVLGLPLVYTYSTFASFYCDLVVVHYCIYISALLWFTGFAIWLVSKAEFKRKVNFDQNLIWVKNYALVVPQIVRVRYPNYLGIMIMEAASALPSLTLWTLINPLVLLFLLREKSARLDCHFSALDSKGWSRFRKQVPQAIFSFKKE